MQNNGRQNQSGNVTIGREWVKPELSNFYHKFFPILLRMRKGIIMPRLRIYAAVKTAATLLTFAVAFAWLGSAQGSAQGALTLTATPDAVAVYNTPIPNSTFTYKLTGFANGDTQATACKGSVELTTPAKQGSAVGIYTINVGGNLSCKGYKITINTGELHITPATLKIVPVSVANVPAGSQVQPYSYNCYFNESLVGTNNCGDNYPITGNPTITTTATTHATQTRGVVVFTAPAGSYDLHATWGSLKSTTGNYTFAFPSGSTLTIVVATGK